MSKHAARLATVKEMTEALETYVKREDEEGTVGYLVVVTEAMWKEGKR